MQDLLRQKGYKATPARIAILKIFSKTKRPLCAEIVFKDLLKQESTKKINEVTVYRTLASLESAGILRKVNLRKDSEYFELNNDHHHHIVCTSCEAVEKFESMEIEKALAQIVDKASKFKNISEHSLELFGVCAKCQKN